MPMAVIEVSIEVPNTAFASQIKCRLPKSVYNKDSIRRYLILRELLYAIDIVLIVRYDIVLDLENCLPIRIRKISVQVRPVFPEVNPNQRRLGRRTEAPDNKVLGFVHADYREAIARRESVTAKSNSCHAPLHIFLGLTCAMRRGL